jgi:hypothetical protein
MTQRQITINAYPLIECGPTSFSVSFDLRGSTPSKRVDINTVDDCKAALADFAAELEPLGKPLHLSVHFEKRSGRKPAGFDKASSARELECHVNAHLAAQRAA